MKKELLFLALTGMAASAAIGQVVIGRADLQVPGKVYKQAVNTSKAATTSVGNAGIGQIWDFSALTKETSDSTGTLLPANTPYGASFPSTSHATLTVDGDGSTYSYYTTSDGKVEVTGIAYESAQIAESPKVVLKTISPINFYTTLPLAIGLKSSSMGTYVGKGKYTAFQGVDSLEITMLLEKSDTVDGWGKLMTPTFPNSVVAIRLKTIAKRTITVRAHSTGPFPQRGWFIVEPPLYTPVTEEQLSYHFWAPSIGAPLLSVAYENGKTAPATSFKWYVDPTTGIEEEKAAFNFFSLSPNPATSVLTINGVNGTYDVSISTIQGANLMSKKSLSGVQTIDISSLTPGLYIANLQNASGKNVKSKFVVE